MKSYDEAVSPVIGVILMVCIIAILAAVIVAVLIETSGYTNRVGDYAPLNETITIVEKMWNGGSSEWGYATTSTGSVYRVYDITDYMRLQVNHTYNVNVDLTRWNFPVITKVNHEELL